MISVAEAERIVLGQRRSFGCETVALEAASGRVLARDIRADRDLPPYDRITMDGVAVRYADVAAGRRVFRITGTQAAGDPPGKLAPGACVQVMTGAVLPRGADTIIPIEEIRTEQAAATVLARAPRRGQYVHERGSDARRGRVLVPAGRRLSAIPLALAASAGQAAVTVSKVPRAAVLTTGDELVEVSAQPAPHQLRRSNNYAITAMLGRYGVPADMLHAPDSPAAMKRQLGRCLEQYELIVISGGVSKGAFDYVPRVLADLSVKTLFHGVRQKPGKPLLFGVHPRGPVVFACPGNPVSAALCVYKYCLPWLRACLGLPAPPPLRAVLERDVLSPRGLHFFAQAKLRTAKTGTVYAAPLANNGSGDFLSLLDADAFLELPAGRARFKKGEVCRAIAFEPII